MSIPCHGLSNAASAALDLVLEPGERVDLVAPAVGSAVILTDRRLAVLRDGASYRPRTGVRSFGLDRNLEVRIGPARRRVIIQSEGHTINVFVRSEQLEQAEVLVAEVRRRIYLD
jgi:hypothetical protein